jgi:hypothetical protein
MTPRLSALQNNRLFWVSFPALLTIALFLAVLTSFPQFRETLRGLLVINSREILAKADADLTGQGFKVSIIKVQTSDSLALEVFQSEVDGVKLQFVRRLVLPESRDAYFNFRGNAANLVVTDVDGDGTLEIVAPTFDDNLVPRLNVYKYDPESKDFFRLGPDSYNL